MARIDLRLGAAVAAGKFAGLTSRRLGIGGGTTIPGLVAERVDGKALNKLASSLSRGTILVTGTNGKTTTSRLLASILGKNGWTTVHNRAGANLLSGVTTALLSHSDLKGRSRSEWGVFEVDEAVMPSLVHTIRPEIVVITNLFRDQLDRFGEIDQVAARWAKALNELPASSVVVLNMDDPVVASLGRRLKARVVGYGMGVAGDRDTDPDLLADSKNCPICRSPLRYRSIQYAHLGRYECPSCSYHRPSLDLSITAIHRRGIDGTDMEISGAFGSRRWLVPLPGLYNSYNVLAAVAAALTLGASLPAIDDAIRDFHAVFGRFEQIRIDNRTLCVVLVKNPVGFTEVIRTILADQGRSDLAILINDNIADGTDVSWLWDVDVERLANRRGHIVVGGARASDMAVRLKYAGVSPERIEQVRSVEQGIDCGLAGIPDGGVLYALPTYTAMIELKAIASRRHYAASFWEN